MSGVLNYIDRERPVKGGAMGDTKKPTAQDIEDARSYMTAGYRDAVVKLIETPEWFHKCGDDLARLMAVLDYAAACLRAEEEGERVPGGIAEHYGVEPEVASAMGTPVWRDERHRWCAYVGEPSVYAYVLYANSSFWNRYPNDGGDDVLAEGRGSLAANIRAATASWNAAHPDMPPVVVPEQFRESEDVLEVEAPEDGGDDGWIAWPGGECPVPRDTLVECDGRDGNRYPAQPAHFFYWDNVNEPADIVRYRIVPEDKPEQTPEQRVAGMSDEEVEAEVTRRGVGRWEGPSAVLERHYRRGYITKSGRCCSPSAAPFNDTEGDTTTEAGRMECTRRLLVHLLREDGS